MRTQRTRSDQRGNSRVLKLALLTGCAWMLMTAIGTGHTEAGLTMRDSPFNCGDDELGKLSVSYSDDVVGNIFECDKVKHTWMLNGGMNIFAIAKPSKIAKPAKLAWLQAIVDADIGPEFQDRTSGKPLAAPYPDTPPGGYKIVSDICNQKLKNPKISPFDNEPWYANHKPGDLTLQDAPRNGFDPKVGKAVDNFESWLVCFGGQTDGTYNVVPLIGFTWGFTYAYDKDKNGNNIVGDQRNEYTSSTSFGGFIAGATGPSAAFKAGYAKYFKLNYLANNEENCKDCTMIPAPMPLPASLPMGLACLLLLLVAKRRRRPEAI